MHDAAGLGVLERDEPDRGQHRLAWIVQDQRDHVVPMPEGAERRFEIHVKEVTEDEDDVPFLRDVREQIGGARDLGARPARLREQQLADDTEEVIPALPRWEELADTVGEEHQPDPVVVVQRGHREERRDIGGKLALGDARRPEPGARRDVHGEEDVELALLAVLLDVRNVHPRGHVPVNAADVVPRLVLADLLEVEPGSPKDAPIGADERLVGEDARFDLDLLYQAKDLGRDGIGARIRDARGGHDQGTATLSRTRAMTTSGVISSASAS